MKLSDLLQEYDTVLLDQLSADKIDEAITLRLPTPVIVQEIISALSSQSYIANKIIYGKPPLFAILNLVLQSSGFKVEIEGFRSRVLSHVEELSHQAARSKSIQSKNAQLYIKILRKSWESDGVVDKSEAHILELVKQELGIWDREHYMLMHDESILQLWDIDHEYYQARNYLLSTGILLTSDACYIIAEEVAVQIRKAFGIDIMDDSYKRLLDCLGRDDLAFALEQFNLNISGTKDVQITRLLNSLVPPADILNLFTLDQLKEVCKRNNIQSSGAKTVVVSNIIEFFDTDQDLQTSIDDKEVSPLPLDPELREMPYEVYAKILMALTGQQLYDILYQSYLMTSGSKEEKVRRIVNSPWSERSVLSHLRKDDLWQLCKKFALPVTGAKQELIDRLLDFSPEIKVPEIPGVILEVEQNDKPTDIQAEEPLTSIGPTESSATLNFAPLPPNWGEICSLFPSFTHEEKLVLALLKEARSVTEQDLHRITIRHRINWFLHKAHMAELIAKLRRINKPFVTIKSVQNNNIYQWIANDQADQQVIEKKAARDIIDALRHGVVPRHNLDLLMVGQQNARKHLSEILLEVNPLKSHFKFIRGQYGSGKTFLCSWLKEFALNNEFAVSFLNISHDQPLSDLPVFFSGLVNALRTPEKTDSSALVDILESWLLNIHNKTARIEGIDPSSSEAKLQLNAAVDRSIEMELAGLNDIDPGFPPVLRAFYEGKVAGNIELVSHVIAWITGSRSLSSQALRDIGVKGYLEPSQVFARMRALLEIINGAKYKGLLLLVDELELVRKFPHARQREQAFETLRLLIDEAGRNALPGCLLVFTGTDEFFEDERYGLRSYEALSERVLTPFTHESFVSVRQPIISLESLDRSRLADVIFKIRDLYGIAYSCDSKLFADDESILQLLEEWTRFGEEHIDRKPRPILREFIQMLDLCEENKGVRLPEFLKKNNAATY
jgi:hypothetical protein